MKKIVRLTESELNRIVERSVRRAINEGVVNEANWKNIAAAAASVPLMYGGMVAHDKVHENDPEIDPQQREINQAVTDEFGSPQGKLPNDTTINFDDARRDPRLNNYHVDSSISNKLESRIRGAVMESIKRLMKENEVNKQPESAKYCYAKYCGIGKKPKSAKSCYAKYCGLKKDENEQN